MAHVFMKVRQAFDDNGLEHIQLGWTTRWNAFYNDENRPAGFKVYDSDGEGILIDQEVKAHGKSLKDILDWVNIMFYDMAPSEVGAPDGLKLENYKQTFGYFEKYLNKEQLVMGFEPGGQSSTGSWEGIDVDKNVVNFIASSPYGGDQFWAIN